MSLFLDQPLIIKVQLVLISLLWLMFIVFSVVIIVHRLRSNVYNFYNHRLERNSERWINEWVLNDNFREVILQKEALAYLKKHYEANYKTHQQKSLLVDILNKLHKSMAGEVKGHVRLFFYTLQLDLFMLDLMKRHAFEDKAKAIRVIAEFKVERASRTIAHYINNENGIIRQEARFAYLLIDPVHLGQVLENIKTPLCDWEVMSFISIIEMNSAAYLQHFRPMFNSPIASVVALSVKIISRFNLLQYKNEMLRLLDSNSNYIVFLCIETIESLSFADAVPLLIIKYRDYNEDLQLTILRLVSRLGSIQQKDFLVKEIASTTSIAVQLTGIKALLGIGVEPDEVKALLTDSIEENQLKAMLAHNLDRRIHVN